MVVMYQIVKTMHHIYVCVCVCISACRLTYECPWNSRHFMRWKIAHPWLGSNPRSLDYIPILINSCHVSDHQSNASHIYFYISGAPDQEIVYESDKNTNWRCPMTDILNFTICGKTVSLTAWHTAEMDSAQKIPIEPIDEVLFLKNAYWSLSRAIFHFLSWLMD